ncbi:unnamed protein product [Adineta ricciae]|uniref:Uncharacterized protein n=1 Tax=Adineta ricciae TaxID=249248 RepID=A0A815PRH9_ADIRI|nr:unnamed protein product [Adineta ricciae]CAF1453552.1 unnamed protein product [Adineta ricciae]
MDVPAHGTNRNPLESTPFPPHSVQFRSDPDGTKRKTTGKLAQYSKPESIGHGTGSFLVNPIVWFPSGLTIPDRQKSYRKYQQRGFGNTGTFNQLPPKSQVFRRIIVGSRQIFRLNPADSTR